MVAKLMIGSGLIVHSDSLEENSFRSNLRADKAGMLAFPRGDELTIENHYRHIFMAFCCIVAIVYDFSHLTSWRKVREANQAPCQNFACMVVRTYHQSPSCHL